MTITAWRITKAKHAAMAFSGAGAKAFGGRWNRPGTAVVYTAGSTSLAVLEVLVHLQVVDLMRRYVLYQVSFDEALITSIDAPALPKNWRQSPVPMLVQEIGDRWVQSGRSAVLRLPSAIVPNEWNYLLNPAHRDFAKIAIGPKQKIKLDPRLVKKG